MFVSIRKCCQSNRTITVASNCSYCFKCISANLMGLINRSKLIVKRDGAFKGRDPCEHLRKIGGETNTLVEGGDRLIVFSHFPVGPGQSDPGSHSAYLVPDRAVRLFGGS